MDAQVELVHWWKTDWANRYAKGFFESMGVDHVTANHPMVARFGDHESAHLMEAPTYWVSMVMGELVDVASRSMPPQPLQESDLPAPSGFVFFQNSIRGPDVRGKVISFRAFSWKPFINELTEKVGVWVTLYSDRDDPIDTEWKDSLNQAGIDHRKMAPPLVMVHMTYWNYGEGWGKEHPGFEDGSLIDPRRYVAAWWTLVQQTISYASEYVPGRPWRRRAERAGQKLKNIVVVTLRKYKNENEDPERGQGAHDDDEAREWSQRWLVGAHWRNQACGPGMKNHRLIFVSPYIKGPSDKPLVLKDRVYRWVR